MPKFIIGDTIQFKAEIRDYEGNRIDPTSINVEIRETNDTLIDTVTLQKESTGVYSGEWTIPSTLSAQTLYAKLVYTAGGYTHIDSKSFSVIDYKSQG